MVSAILIRVLRGENADLSLVPEKEGFKTGYSLGFRL